MCLCAAWHCVGRILYRQIAEEQETVMEDDIGIPNVPAIVWEAEQRIARERLDAGRCPRHNVPIIETHDEEYCPVCAEEDR